MDMRKASESSRGDNVQYLLDEGEAAFFNHKWDYSLDIWKKIIRQNPANMKALNRIRDILAVNGNIKGVLDFCINHARFLISLKLYREAIFLLESSLRINPADYILRLMIIEIHKEQGNIDEAFSQFLKWGRVFKKENLPEIALLFMQNAIEISPLDIELTGEIAEIFVEVKHQEQALRLYNDLTSNFLRKDMRKEAKSSLSISKNFDKTTATKIELDCIHFGSGQISSGDFRMTGLLSLETGDF